MKNRDLDEISINIDGCSPDPRCVVKLMEPDTSDTVVGGGLFGEWR